jgi:hypothetical protein
MSDSLLRLQGFAGSCEWHGVGRNYPTGPGAQGHADANLAFAGHAAGQYQTSPDWRNRYQQQQHQNGMGDTPPAVPSRIHQVLREVPAHQIPDNKRAAQ